MIVSCSVRTDIPAFYGAWFRNRLEAGYCMVRNPFGGQIYRVDLTRPAVSGFVFWTRNLGPFLDTLQMVHDRGYPFVVQYTITGYPRTLEPSVVEPERAIGHMRQVAELFGPRVAVWRYDPIVFSTETPAEFHRAGFTRLARALEGTTDEVAISFAQIYRKTRRNMDRAASRHGFDWTDPPDEVKLELAGDLVDIARQHGMRLAVCTQPQFVVPGAVAARCIDADRLSDVAGSPILARRRGTRPGCECSESRDIGEYDTCPHGCAYCYAVANREVARRRYVRHDPNGEFLFSVSELPIAR